MSIRIFKTRVDHIDPKRRPAGIKKMTIISIEDTDDLPEGWSYTKEGAWEGKPVTKKPGKEKPAKGKDKPDSYQDDL